MKYMKARREALGGYLPARRRESESLAIPDLSVFDAVLKVRVAKSNQPLW